MEKEILTRDVVKSLGLDKVSVITSEMLDGYIGIGNNAFRNCTGLTSVTIPNSVTCIGFWSFYGCTALTSIEIPNSITLICDSAFKGCYSLKSIEIPASDINIGDYAFCGCINLTSVTIPNSVTSIGMGAFYGCSGLTAVTIGDKIYEKQTITNSNCKAYKGFNSNMTCMNFQYKEGKTYEICGEPKLCKNGFHACLSLADVFTYYAGKIGKDIVVHEVELEGISDERQSDSKVVAKKITIGKRIL